MFGVAEPYLSGVVPLRYGREKIADSCFWLKDMDISQIRRQNAIYLADSIGGQAAFIERMGKHQGLVSQWIGDNANPKAIGNKIAREIETKFSKPHGWLDMPHPDLWGKTSPQEPAPLHELTPETIKKLLKLDRLLSEHGIELDQDLKMLLFKGLLDASIEDEEKIIQLTRPLHRHPA